MSDANPLNDMDECPWCARELDKPVMIHMGECPIATSGNMGLQMNGVQRFIQQLAEDSEGQG